MSKTNSLPAGFETLERFVEIWSVTGAANRARLRLDSCADDRNAFFAETSDMAAPALALLDQKPIAEFGVQENNLMNLMLSLVHVSLAVEIQGDDEPGHARDARFMKITRTSEDFQYPA